MAQPLLIYFAGPLFTLAERRFNQECAKELLRHGFHVLLPQEVAELFRRPDGTMDLSSMADNCRRMAIDSDVMVAILDGPDVDSGTALEIGVRHEHTKLLIGVRTDFRSSEDEKTGVNAMFRLLNYIIRYSGESVEKLCDLIAEEIRTRYEQECVQG